MVHVITTAPTRIDLAGGTLDLWPIHHNLQQAYTVNVAVSCLAKVEIQTRRDRKITITSLDQKIREDHDDLGAMRTSSKLTLISDIIKNIWPSSFPGLDLSLEAKSPKGAGLGGSSTLGICLTASLLYTLKNLPVRPAYDQEWTENAIVDLVRNVESRIIKAPAGIQDHWAAMRGGINILSYPDTGVKIETLATDMVKTLNRRMILVYTGASRDSAMNNWVLYKNFFNADPATLKSMQAIADLAASCAEAVKKGDFEQALHISEREWQVRKNLWPSITTEEFDHLNQAACLAGANFSRFCGAGGGGVMAVFFPESKRLAVIEACQRAGGTILEAEITNQGVSSELVSLGKV